MCTSWGSTLQHSIRQRMQPDVAVFICRYRYADKANMEVGLLFTCRLGNVDLDRPVGAQLPAACCYPSTHLLSRWKDLLHRRVITEQR